MGIGAPDRPRARKLVDNVACVPDQGRLQEVHTWSKLRKNLHIRTKYYSSIALPSFWAISQWCLPPGVHDILVCHSATYRSALLDIVKESNKYANLLLLGTTNAPWTRHTPHDAAGDVNAVMAEVVKVRFSMKMDEAFARSHEQACHTTLKAVNHDIDLSRDGEIK